MMTYATIPEDCIDRVTSDGGDRELFRTTWNSKATAQGNVEQELAMPAAAAFHFGHRPTELLGTKQDGSKHILEVDQASGNLEQSVSTMDEIHTDDVDVTTSTFPSEGTRIIKLWNELKLVQTKFVFVKILRRRTWNPVKSAVKPSTTWWTLNSSNWGLLTFNVPRVNMLYSRGPLFAHVASISDRTKRRYNESRQLFTFSTHVISARLQSHQEVAIMVISSGSYTHAKAQDALLCASKGKRDFASIWDRWENDSQFQQTPMTHGWTYASVRYLDQLSSERRVDQPRSPKKGQR